MNKNFQKIKNHPDKDEIISKLSMGVSSKDISEWLKAKYCLVGDAKFVISEKNLKEFSDTYLDFQELFQEDVMKAKSSLKKDDGDSIELSIQNNPEYKERLLDLVGKEIDIKQIITRLCLNIEFRLGQIFDSIQEDPRNINTRVDRLLIEYTKALADSLDKFYKFTTVQPDQVVQHNVNLQIVDQHISVLHEAIRETLAEIDNDASMLFVERVSQKMLGLQPASENVEKSQSTDSRLAEVKLLNENILSKLEK